MVGGGFTEWTNVKKSKPQFKGHYQPEVPLNDNYYCLLDSKVQEEQSQLALKYGIDGFCYYHYWFEGKMLLEKPMENMLHNPNIKVPFCICWANETWSRTWDGSEKTILIKQNYNEDENGWKRHFDYLLQFFKDERYILDDGRPILIIYKPYLIENCKEMILYWRKLAKREGFKDLFIGYQYPKCFAFDMEDLGFDFGIEFEPLYTSYINNESKCNTVLKKIFYNVVHPSILISNIKYKIGYPKIHNYDKVWKSILNRKPSKDNICAGAFPSWDNTPRRGNHSSIYKNSSPDKFKFYLKKQIQHAQEKYGMNYLFINAWNEWAEGAHLEPDDKNKFGYLEAVREADK